MPIARLSSKSQIVIPAEIRNPLGLKPGDVLNVEEKNGVIVMRKPETSVVLALEKCQSPAWKGSEEELSTLRNEWDL